MRTFIQILISLTLVVSCTYRNTTEDNNKYKEQLSNDAFPFRKTYSWAFKLMGVNQKSIHSFYSDSIVYEMKGKIHSTLYTMYKLSYNSEENKWIGQTSDSIVYVLFFKDVKDKSLTLYKRKCKTEGLKEALETKMPSPDTTEDHGWNVYHLDGYEVEDKLPLSGDYSNKNHQISISDSLFIIDDKSIEKMSYHSGERRWVGKQGERYLQVFFENLETTDSIKLSISWFKDLEALYNTKYNEAENWHFYKVVNK